MRACAPLLVAAVALVPASSARAADGPLAAATGPVVAVRGAAAWPWGDVASDDAAVRHYAERRATFGIELGYRVHPRFWGQLYFDLGPATAGRALCAGTDCTASDVRFGVAMVFRLVPGARVDPWLGLGAGVEVLNAKGTGPGGAQVAWSWTGVEAPVLEVGLDVRVADALTLGPWVSASAARFTSGAVRKTGGDTESHRIGRWAAHGWIGGGAKLTLLL